MDYRKIAKIRKAKKITQEELAERSGYSRTQIQNIETGKSGTLVETLEKIAEVLEVEMKVWWEDEGSVVTDVSRSYGKVNDQVIHEMLATIEDLRNDKRMLLKYVDELRGKQGLGKDGTCG